MMCGDKSQRWAWTVMVGFGVYFLLIANGFMQWVNVPFDVALEMLIIHTIAFTVMVVTLFNGGFSKYLVPISALFFYLGFIPVLNHFALFHESESLMDGPIWTKNWFHVLVGVSILIAFYAVMFFRERR